MRVINYLKNKHIALILVVTISFLFIHIARIVMAAEPGTDANPLVTQDYVDAKVNDLAAKINDLTAKFGSLSQQGQNAQPQQSEKFEVVEVKAGKQLVAGASTEIILRQGAAKAVGSKQGGLSDISFGGDLQTNDNISPNHLLIVPLDDGRGLVATTDIKLLLKGTYTIK